MKDPAIIKRPIPSLFEAVFLLIFFLAVLSLPLVGMIFHLDTAPVWDNRRLASFPALSGKPADIVRFPTRFADYFKDHFGFRGGLIRAQAMVRVKWLRTPSVPAVIMGTDGWLFYSGEKLGDYYSGTRPFSEDEMAQWLRVLEARRDWLRQKGIVFYFIVVPEKQTIYPEYMPDEIVRLRSDSRLDQLIEYFKARSTVEILDLRSTLFAEKSRHRVYQRTNSHWNDLGAFAAYKTIARKISDSFPAVHPLPETDFRLVTEYRPDGDLAGMLGLNGIIAEENLDLIPLRTSKALSEGRPVRNNPIDPNHPLVTEKDEANLPRLVMFHDSFSVALIPFLAEHFSHAVYVWQLTMNRQLIESEVPNIVIMEMTERQLMFNPREDLPTVQPAAGRR